MFNPYDEASHAGLLTGMNRRAIGTQRRSLGGPIGQPLLVSQLKLMPEVLSALSALGQKYEGVANLDPKDVAAYMANVYNPPGAKATPQEKLLFLAAQTVANQTPSIVELKKKLSDVIQMQANKTAAAIDVAKYQAVLDNLPTEIKKAQDTLDIAMSALSSAAEETDKAFLYFIDWMQHCVHDAVDRAPGTWTQVLAGMAAFASIPLTIINPVAGAAGVAGATYAIKKIQGIKDFAPAVDMSNGQAAINLMTYLTYNVWDGESKGNGAPLKEISPLANPPLLYKGKSISGVRIADDGNAVFCFGPLNVYFKPGEMVLSALPGSPWDAPGKWTIKTQNVGKGKATRIKYLGPSGKPYAYMPLASVWNANVVPRIETMATLWPAVQAAKANYDLIAAAGVEANDMIAKAKQVELLAGGQTNAALANITKSLQFGSGFVQGYADVLTQLAKTLGDVLSTTVTTTKALDAAETALDAEDAALSKAQSQYTAAVTEQDLVKRAALLQAVAASADVLSTLKSNAETACKAAQTAFEKIAQAQSAAVQIKQSNDVAGWYTYFNKIQNTLTSAQPRLTTAQTRNIDLAAKSTKLKDDVDAAAKAAAASVGKQDAPPKKEETPPPPTQAEKSNVAVPLALGLVAVAAALRG